MSWNRKHVRKYFLNSALFMFFGKNYYNYNYYSLSAAALYTLTEFYRCMLAKDMLQFPPAALNTAITMTNIPSPST